jgi:hypothetical protein
MKQRANGRRVGTEIRSLCLFLALVFFLFFFFVLLLLLLKVGGTMANPDKAGWIRKQGNTFHEGWNKRYMAIKDGTLCYYTKYEDFVEDRPITSIDTLLVTVKIGKGGAKSKNHQVGVAVIVFVAP